MNAGDIRTLYAFDRWANRRMVDASADTFADVRETVVHILWSEWIWLERWLGQSPKKVFDAEEFLSAAEVRARWSPVERGQQDFIAQLTDQRLVQRIAYENVRGERWEYTLGQMMQHVVNHSTYHRGQVMRALRQLGRTPPATDYLIYFDEGEPH